MIFRDPLPEPTVLRSALRAATRCDETELVQRLTHEATFAPEAADRIAERARQLVHEVRRNRRGEGGIDAFMHEFELSSREGVVLMCLAEALLRVPDAETVDKLIKDKIAEADWQAHLGHSDSLFVNASTWALMLTGRVVQLDESDTRDLAGVLRRLVERGDAVIVIEHHVDLLAACDRLVELGPGGGAAGGRLIASGSPAELAASDESVTGPWLREVMERQGGESAAGATRPRKKTGTKVAS